MSVYTQYVNNFSNSIDALDCERKRSKAFNNFLQVHSRFAEELPIERWQALTPLDSLVKRVIPWVSRPSYRCH